MAILLSADRSQDNLGADGEAAGAVAGSDGIALGNQGVLGVDFDDLVLVFDVDVNVALAVDLRELGLTADGNRSGDDVVGLGVDRRGIAAAAVEGEDAMGDRLINDGVGIRAGLDLAAITLLVFMSNTVTALSRPSEVKPLPRSAAMAMPWTPLVSGMVPMTLSVVVSITSVCVPCETYKR